MSHATATHYFDQLTAKYGTPAGREKYIEILKSIEPEYGFGHRSIFYSFPWKDAEKAKVLRELGFANDCYCPSLDWGEEWDHSFLIMDNFGELISVNPFFELEHEYVNFLGHDPLEYAPTGY